MPRIEAQPPALRDGGARAQALSGRLSELRGLLEGIGSASGAAGHPATRAAIEEACRGLAEAIAALEQQAAGLGANLHGAGTAYSETDETAIPDGAASGSP